HGPLTLGPHADIGRLFFSVAHRRPRCGSASAGARIWSSAGPVLPRALDPAAPPTTNARWCGKNRNSAAPTSVRSTWSRTTERSGPAAAGWESGRRPKAQQSGGDTARSLSRASLTSLAGSADLLAGRPQLLGSLDDPLGHTGLGRLAPGAGVVGLLIAHFAVDLEHTVIVGEHVRGSRAGEGVLGVGVDVHLDHTVVHCGGDLFGRGAGSAVEHQVERALLADLLADLFLDLAEQLRAQLDVPGLVHAVHVAEGQGSQVAALLTGAQRAARGQAVLGGGVELFVDFVGHTVLFATDAADLHLEQSVRGERELEQFLGNLQVLLQGNGRAVPHVRLEGRQLAGLDLVGLDGQQRADPAVQVLLGAVVGVQ